MLRVLFACGLVCSLLFTNAPSARAAEAGGPGEGVAALAYVEEPAKRVPVAYDVDVAVAGAGVSGVFAAIAAAREGASTVLIDRFGSVGGNMGPGLYSPANEFVDRSRNIKQGAPDDPIKGEIAGLIKEFAERFAAVKPTPQFVSDFGMAEYVSFCMLKEAGVKLILSAYVADPIIEGNRVCGVFVETKSGRQAVRAKVVIDATGDADLARRAGLPVLYPQASAQEFDGHAPTGMGTRAIVAGIDPQKFNTPPNAESRNLKVNIADLAQLELVLQYNPAITGSLGFVKTELVRPHPKVNMGDARHISILESEVRRYVFEFILRCREKIPGCENLYLLTVAPYFGSRGGPCIEGEYTLTKEDCIEGKRFDDVVYVYGEAHALRINCAQGECKWTDVPYRVMIPKKLDGLMAVGRSASGSPDTLLRIREAVMYMGQAGGTAAAMCAKSSVPPRKLDVKQLQKRLLDAGFYLGDETRLAELGLK